MFSGKTRPRNKIYTKVPDNPQRLLEVYTMHPCIADLKNFHHSSQL